MKTKSRKLETPYNTVIQALKKMGMTDEDESLYRAINSTVVDRINQIVRIRRTKAMAEAVHKFKIGDKVKFFSSKRNHRCWIHGEITGFGTRGILLTAIDSFGRTVRWTVSANLVQHEKEVASGKRK